MQIYIYVTVDLKTTKSVSVKACLVRAEEQDGEFKVLHPDNGYSIWPADQFHKQHRALTMRETQMVNLSPAELQVMSITDGMQKQSKRWVDGRLVDYRMYTLDECVHGMPLEHNCNACSDGRLNGT